MQAQKNIGKVSRAFKWVSATDERMQKSLEELQEKMQQYYSQSETYYSDIDFTYNVWSDPTMVPQLDIVQSLVGEEKILEIGCGKANILRNQEINEAGYFGIDFSESLMLENKERYPLATFRTILDPKKLDFPDNYFDVVFSHFVIEHSVYPHFLLSEKMRVLKKGGTLIIICPDFMGKDGITSQRTGFSPGTGSKKLKEGKILDAFVTLYDNKIRLPFYCNRLRKRAKISPAFMINIQPRCFIDSFQPDVDAVYVTYEHEMRSYCSTKIQWRNQNETVDAFCKSNALIYLKGCKI